MIENLGLFEIADRWRQYGRQRAVYPKLWDGSLVGSWIGPQAGVGTQVRDESGRNNHGTLAGATHLPTWINDSYRGQSFRSLQMVRANSQYVATDCSTTGLTDFTISTWVNLSSLQDAFLMCSANATVTGGVFVLFENAVNYYFEVGFYDAAGNFSRIRASALPVVGTWYHVLGTHVAGSSAVAMRVNGISVGTQFESSASTIGASAQGVVLGRYGATSSYYLDGRLSDSRLYRRVLSANEISTLALGPLEAYAVRLPEYFFASAAGGTDYTRTISDALGLSDSAIRALAYIRSCTDAFGLTDVTSRVAEFTRQTADAAGLTDAATREAAFARTAAESIELTDAAAREAVFARVAGDVVETADSTSRVAEFNRVESDTEGITDTIFRSIEFARSWDDTEGLTDEALASKGFIQIITDSVGLTDTVSKASGFNRTATDQESLADTCSRIVVFVRIDAELEGLSDVVVALYGSSSIQIIRATLETLTIPGAFLETLMPITVSSEGLSKYSVVTETLIDSN